MGQLVDGIWRDEWYDTESSGGRFQRSVTAYRNWVTADGSPGPTGEGGFAAESGRYHLYVSYACPWAHRTLIFRALKGLEPHIDVSVVHPDMLSDGWTFATDFPGATGDRQFGLPFLRDIYLRADPRASGRVTVPVLWDKKGRTIVSNVQSSPSWVNSPPVMSKRIAPSTDSPSTDPARKTDASPPEDSISCLSQSKSSAVFLSNGRT